MVFKVKVYTSNVLLYLLLCSSCLSPLASQLNLNPKPVSLTCKLFSQGITCLHSHVEASTLFFKNFVVRFCGIWVKFTGTCTKGGTCVHHMKNWPRGIMVPLCLFPKKVQCSNGNWWLNTDGEEHPIEVTTILSLRKTHDIAVIPGSCHENSFLVLTC